MSKQDPWRITIGGHSVAEVPALKEAHRVAQRHCAVSGRNVSIWHGGRKVLTYFGWRGQNLYDKEGR